MNLKVVVSALLLLASNICTAQISYSIDELTVEEGKTFTVPESASKIAISRLVMKKGSRISIPPDSKSFEFIIDNGTFLSNTTIISAGKTGSDSSGVGQKGGTGLSGSLIVFKVNHATFSFDQDPAKPQFFSIQTNGGTGGKGGPGASGQNAATSNCNSAGNGHPASVGGQGAPGGDGGAGNEIRATIRLVKDHPIITDKEIQLKSIGGLGGAGGNGGAGGAGSPTVCCQRVLGNCVMRRGGNTAAGPGGPGPQGAAGANGQVQLDLSFEKL